MGAPRGLLVFNSGSSSLKAELFLAAADWRPAARAVVAAIGTGRAMLQVDGLRDEPLDVATHGSAAEIVLDRFWPQASAAPVATAHRIVHGGDVFAAPEIVTEAVRARLGSLAPLAPLHNPPALEVLDAARRRFRDAPAVAVFDTAFFRELPEAARAYAIPRGWRRGGAVRRYGFHGIAHQYLFGAYRASTARRSTDRVVTLHLGNGCSAAALLRGRPVETSMGYTPLEGLIMGTRSGDLDSGILIERLRQGADWAALDSALQRESGLLGLSERSSDMAELLALEVNGDPGARLAVDAFCHRARKYVGAYAAVLGGLDAIVFGGGIGENAPAVRARICAGFNWLGLELDAQANDQCRGRAQSIAKPGSAVDVAVIEVREERAIARDACERLGISAAGLLQ